MFEDLIKTIRRLIPSVFSEKHSIIAWLLGCFAVFTIYYRSIVNVLPHGIGAVTDHISLSAVFLETSGNIIVASALTRAATIIASSALRSKRSMRFSFNIDQLIRKYIIRRKSTYSMRNFIAGNRAVRASAGVFTLGYNLIVALIIFSITTIGVTNFITLMVGIFIYSILIISLIFVMIFPKDLSLAVKSKSPKFVITSAIGKVFSEVARKNVVVIFCIIIPALYHLPTAMGQLKAKYMSSSSGYVELHNGDGFDASIFLKTADGIILTKPIYASYLTFLMFKIKSDEAYFIPYSYLKMYKETSYWK